MHSRYKARHVHQEVSQACHFRDHHFVVFFSFPVNQPTGSPPKRRAIQLGAFMVPAREPEVLSIVPNTTFRTFAPEGDFIVTGRPQETGAASSFNATILGSS